MNNTARNATERLLGEIVSFVKGGVARPVDFDTGEDRQGWWARGEYRIGEKRYDVYVEVADTVVASLKEAEEILDAEKTS